MVIMDKEHSKPEKSEQPTALPEAAEVEELDLEEFSKMHGGKPQKPSDTSSALTGRNTRSTCQR